MSNAAPTGFAVKPTALDGQAITQFGPYTFPAAHHELDGEQRDHIHEYPHRDGGAPEKLGRRLYVCEVRGQFHSNFPSFPGLYPDTLNYLQQMFEQGVTDTFTHPSVGSYPAYIKRWKRRRDPRMRSGEVCDMVFMEDQTTAFLTADITGQANFASMTSNADALAQQLAVVQAANALSLSPQALGIFGAIQTLSNDIGGIADTANMYGNLVSAKCQQLSNLCRQLDGDQGMQDARAGQLVDILHDLWQQAQVTSLDSLSRRTPALPYTVPSTMPLTAIAARLYAGDASRADDLMALNAVAIPDQLNVKAGTAIMYYPDPVRAATNAPVRT